MRKTVCPLVLAAFASVACASRQVEVAPRVDLMRYGTVGMIEFSSSGFGGHDMARMATNQFVAVVQAAQPGVPIVELGAPERVLATLERERLDLDTIKAIGREYGVDVVLVGELRSEHAVPSLSVKSLSSFRAGAKIEGLLSARLYQTRSGATLWTNAVRGTQSLGEVSLAEGGLPTMSGQDPDTAEQELVRDLVATLTRDFRSRRVRR